MTSTERAEIRMALARAATLQKAPYYAAVVHNFVFHPIQGIGTMLCTKKMILGYDPEWACEGTVDELAADIAHECNHFLRRHFERGESVEDHGLYNLAGDLAINPDLKNGGWSLCEKGNKAAVFPQKFGFPENLTTEAYYELLLQQKSQNKSPSTNERADGGSGQGIGQGHCGGLAGNAENEKLEKELDGIPDLGRSDTEINSAGHRAAGDIKEYAEQHGRSAIPASLLDSAARFTEESPIRWQDELASLIRDATGRMQAGGDDFSLRRPSKRSYVRGFLRPGLIESLPEVAFIRDSSGSMGAAQLTTAAREAYHIMAALGIEEVWFADADTQIAIPWARVGPTFFKNLTDAHGRGGTDFRPGIESATHLSPKPDILIYATDGDGTTTCMPPPDLTVVWAIVPSHYNQAPATWGHTVIISDDPQVRKKGVKRG